MLVCVWQHVVFYISFLFRVRCSMRFHIRATRPFYISARRSMGQITQNLGEGLQHTVYRAIATASGHQASDVTRYHPPSTLHRLTYCT